MFSHPMYSSFLLPKAFEILPACVIAGMGMVFAGTYVDWVKSNYAEQFDPRLLAMIPPLIGLKGNLEVTLSSRLATMANIRTEINIQALSLFLSTMVYILIQGVSAAVVISLICVTLYSCLGITEFTDHGFLHLTTVSILTCIIAICALSCLVFGLIICCVYLGIDPDNVAPPMAAALGDLATVTVLLFANQYYLHSPNFLIAVTFASMTIIFSAGPYYLKRDSVSSLCSDFHGMTITWLTFRSSVTPLLGAVFMSSLSGQVLAHFAHQLPNLARLQIAINGVGGCFGSIVVSRMITRIHAKQEKRTSPPPGRKLMEAEPSDVSVVEDIVDFSQSTGKMTPPLIPNTSRLSDAVLNQQVTSEVVADASHVSCFILAVCVPIHFVLALISLALHRLATSDQSLSEDEFTFNTVIAYVLAAFIQVCIVLRFARWIVLSSWRHLAYSGHRFSVLCARQTGELSSSSLASLDLTAIALTTGLGDLLGSILLTSTLYLLQG
ncbi:hypothetical protein EG68_00726 [Paragonimus skrjabini miyazakii]|uniref:SLC41A/MgtE integral membrane domain-containing protein n=1 Tax=Paragonimus skrjabini miyazakii TaxID=59628 RepID=A0A8S9Z7Z4_9TREM|nr:hypothetical protein EG68_00726 [Paragonimus skrjabini miyazakii]